MNGARSYLYEPPGSIHTLYAPADNAEITETLTVVYGRTEYLDADGAVVAVTDAATNLELYSQACDTAGVARSAAILR